GLDKDLLDEIIHLPTPAPQPQHHRTHITAVASVDVLQEGAGLSTLHESQRRLTTRHGITLSLSGPLPKTGSPTPQIPNARRYRPSWRRWCRRSRREGAR